MKYRYQIFATLFAAACSAASAQAQTAESVQVTPDNFARAESDMYFAGRVNASGIGVLNHSREPFSIDNQTVIRGNRDTLYSSGVFDLDAGLVTIDMPDPRERFMSLMVINEDHYVVGLFHDGGIHTLDKSNVGTRYAMIAVRTLVDPSKTADIEEAHRLQDAIKVTQPGGPGKWEAPVWDKASQDKVRNALLVLDSTMSTFNDAFGSKDKVDPVRHLIATAAGWGGNPDGEAAYVGVTPEKNDGKTVYRLHVPADVPVDGFWSISRYTREGYFQKNEFNAYSLNNLTAVKAADGSVDVQFGGCDGKIPNCLPIEDGWNYTVRLYQPRAEILNGTWKFPDPTPVS